MKFWQCIFIFTSLFAWEKTEWESHIAYYEDGEGGWNDERLTYASDPACNRIPNFSHAGTDISQIETVITLSPYERDIAWKIQNALNTVPTPGAVLLLPGKPYFIDDAIQINRSGVVLRGIVDRDHPEDPSKSTQLIVDRLTLGCEKEETTPLFQTKSLTFVPIGAYAFEVEDRSGFSVGDTVQIACYTRTITAVSPFVTLDAPLFHPLPAEATFTKCTPTEHSRHIGLESLHLIAQEVALTQIEKSWFSQIHLEGGGLRTKQVSFLTFANNNIEAELHLQRGSEHLLFNRTQLDTVHTEPGVAGIVFLDSTLSFAENAPNCNGFLFDNVSFQNRVAPTLTNSVAWVSSCEANIFPDATNFAIGCSWARKGSTYTERGPKNKYLHPSSLYEAQKREQKTYGSPPNPPLLKTLIKRGDEITLQWACACPEQNHHFSVERSDNRGSCFCEIARLPANCTAFTDKEASGAVMYRVRCLNDVTGNRSAYSNPLSAHMGGTFARFVRLFIPPEQKHLRQVDVHIFEVYGTDEENLSQHCPVCASSCRKEMFSASHAVDGNSLSKWSVLYRKRAEWISVDLGNERELSHITLRFSKEQIPPHYEIHLSSDGEAWIPFFTESDSNNGTFYFY